MSAMDIPLSVSIDILIGDDVKEVYRMIEALLVLHNFLELRRDNPEHIPHFNGQEDEDVQDVLRDVYDGFDMDMVSDDDLYRMGLLRRKELLNLMDNL